MPSNPATCCEAERCLRRSCKHLPWAWLKLRTHNRANQGLGLSVQAASAHQGRQPHEDPLLASIHDPDAIKKCGHCQVRQDTHAGSLPSHPTWLDDAHRAQHPPCIPHRIQPRLTESQPLGLHQTVCCLILVDQHQLPWRQASLS